MLTASEDLAVKSRDPLLYGAHDGINILVFLILIGLYNSGPNWLIDDYVVGKFLHLCGFVWFFGGLVLASFAMSRYVWTQASLDHKRLADGYRFILILELWCIPSIALIAYGGMVMIVKMGGLDAHVWAYQAYWFLLVTPPILMIIPRFYHKRFIKDPNVDIAREKRSAFWQDWGFIIIMTLFMAALVLSMIRKMPMMG